jgi:hypothetical protein
MGRTVAAPRNVPLGTRVYIYGVGWRIAEDRTAPEFDGRWDVFVTSHAAAKRGGISTRRICGVPVGTDRRDVRSEDSARPAVVPYLDLRFLEIAARGYALAISRPEESVDSGQWTVVGGTEETR